jgi:Polyribonucleotide nucleotidyltransferase (polynucleotide phosphorylase)
MKLETGRMAKQANGSVLVTYGDTVVLVAATAAKGSGDREQIFSHFQFFMLKKDMQPDGFLEVS